LDNRPHKVLPYIAISAAIGSVTIAIGAAIHWDYFVNDTFEMARRPIRYDHLLWMLLSGNPIDHSSPFLFNVWTLPGLILSFYILSKEIYRREFFLSYMLALIYVYIFIGGSIFWAFLAPVYPLYVLAIAVVLKDIWDYSNYFGPQLAVLVFFLIVPHFMYGHTLISGPPILAGFILLVFTAASFLTRVMNLPQRKMYCRLSAILIISFISLSAAQQQIIPSLMGNDVLDQKAVVHHLNLKTRPSDLVAGPPPVIALLRSGIGVNYFDVALFNSPFTYHEYSPKLLSRFHLNLSLSNIKYFVIDTTLSDVPGTAETIRKVRASWYEVFSAGDLTVFVNPRLIGICDLPMMLYEDF
jgi:hypothetical protein